MVPLAPPRLSMTNCWPRRCDSFSAIGRMMASDGPPAVHGLMTSTGLDGYASCAKADAASRPSDTASTPARRRIGEMKVIGGPSRNRKSLEEVARDQHALHFRGAFA